MSDNHHEFTDAESASFLHAADRSTRKEFVGGNSNSARWMTRCWRPISCFLPYVLLVVCVSEALVIWRVSSRHVGNHLLRSQDMLGKSKYYYYDTGGNLLKSESSS